VNLPNLITLGRLLSVPVAVWLVLSGAYAAAFLLFVAAGISDGVDGFIAKRYDMRSRLGALLDPLADKALLVSMYVTLGIAGQLPNWLVILVVFRDILIVGGFLVALAVTQPIKWDPLAISKVNTVLQIALIAVLLGRQGFHVEDFGLTTILVFVVGATTVLSGGAYLVRWTRALAGDGAGS
jgi:cardiolipin synthase (CMP-forming)